MLFEFISTYKDACEGKIIFGSYTVTLLDKYCKGQISTFLEGFSSCIDVGNGSIKAAVSYRAPFVISGSLILTRHGSVAM